MNSNSVSVLLGNGDGTFQPKKNTGTVPSPIGVGAADFNGDGKSDLVTVQNGGSTVDVLFGKGNGTFQTPITLTASGGCSSLVVGDFNGDNQSDVAVGCSSGVTIFLSNGDGTFQGGKVELEPVENGDEEIHLAPQRISQQASVGAVHNATPGKFGGNPYLVGSPVTTTTTLPEAETNIAVNPTNPSTLVGIITDYSLRPGNDLTNGVSKYTVSTDGGTTWSDSFVPLNTSYGYTSDGVSWLVDRDPGIGIDRQNNVYFSGLYLKLAPSGSSATNLLQNNLISRQTYPGGVYVCAGTLPNISMTNAQCRPVFTYTNAKGNTTSVDRDWLAVDAGSTSSFEGNVYVVWTHYTGCTLTTCQTKFIAFSRSTDHGVTWSPILQINTTAQTIVDWPMVTVGNDGTFISPISTTS